MTDTPADTSGFVPAAHRSRDGEEPRLETQRDVLTPDLRARTEAEGRDPEEVDPIEDDEATLRRASLGGSTALD